jgi:Ca2+:H+ antiporter
MPSNEGAAENIGLLSGQASPRSNPNSRWGHWVRDFVHASKITLGQSYTNWVLFCVPLGLVAGAQGWNPSAVFLINFVALFPLSFLLAFSTEELAKSVGQTVGGLVNATFGNALEMIVRVVI